MVSTYATFQARPEAVAPEKEAPLLDEKSQPLSSRLESYHEEDAGRGSFSGLLAKPKSGLWIVVLELYLLGFGFFAIFRRDGIYDSVQTWLADPTIIPEQPIKVLGYSFQVKRDTQQRKYMSNEFEWLPTDALQSSHLHSHLYPSGPSNPADGSRIRCS